MNTIIVTTPIDYQIFQQENGKSDIMVQGTVNSYEPGFAVYLALVREYNGTYIRFWEEACANEKAFSHIFKDVPAGGTYSIHLTYSKNLFEACEIGKFGAVVTHIGVGDLYVIAGQSNSAGFAKTPAASCPKLGIHLFRNSCRFDIAYNPMNDPTDTKHPENSEATMPGQSPYLAFADMLKKELGYPIGLIQTSVGGSPLSCWNKRENGMLYKNLINTVMLCGGKVKGILWYQGETDAYEEETAESYSERFFEFVDDLRKDLTSPNLPIITAQLNKLLQNTDTGFDRRWAKIREAQRNAAEKDENILIVPTLDLTLSDTIHNNAQSNNTIGERMACIALEKIYSKEYHAAAPNVSSLTISDDNTVTVRFDNVTMYLVSFGVPVERLEFVFEDETGTVPFDSYSFAEKSITVHLSKKPQGGLFASYAPASYCSCFHPFDRGTGLPILAFYRKPCQNI